MLHRGRGREKFAALGYSVGESDDPASAPGHYALLGITRRIKAAKVPFHPFMLASVTCPAGPQLTQTIHSAVFKFPLKGHVVMSNEDSDAVELALGKLPLIPAETRDVSLQDN